MTSKPADSTVQRTSALHRLTQALVSRPSVNPMGTTRLQPKIHGEARVSRFVEQWAKKRNIPCRRMVVQKDRVNLLLEFTPAEITRTILWEAHQDTVPTTGMIIPPFDGKIENGRLYGRGACDVKGSIAVMLHVLDRLHQEKPTRGAKILLALTVDEEFALTGIQALVREGIRADFAITAEPTQLRIVNQHKGTVRWVIETEGKACHSSQPGDGVNAIYRMGRIIRAVETYAEELQKRPSYSPLGSATLSLGTIQGGLSVNTVPDRCQIELDRRLLPGESATDCRKELEAFLQQQPGLDFPFRFSPSTWMCPALMPVDNNPAIPALTDALASVGLPAPLDSVPYGTDASTLADAGIPTVVFGPGDIAQAHTIDEWIDLKQLDMAAQVLYYMAQH